MRLTLAVFFVLILTQPVFSQASSKSQMQAQMKEAVNELNKQIIDLEKQIVDAKKNKEDESTIKPMEDQMAMLKKQVEMMGGVTKSISKIFNKTFEQAVQEEDNSKTVPKKDVARVKLLPDKILSDAELIPFVKNIHAGVEKLINSENKTEAMEIYAALKSEKKNSDDINNTANTLWITGNTEMALFILGKECVGNMGNDNNLNNYAAFLTMKGAEHAAIPILQNLNRKFPNNTTILNNMGQAWYGLGDMNNANRYLDSTVNIYKNHPHANETKSEIQKSEGKIEESIESLKRSLEEDYTPEKEAQLKERGYTVKFVDIKFKYPVKAEPLGIEQFMFSIPAYPFEGGIAAQMSYNEWSDFKNKITAAKEALQPIFETQKAAADAYKKKLLANPALLFPYNNRVCKTAGRKLTLLITEWGFDRTMALNEELLAASDTISRWKEEYSQAIRNVEDCGARKALATSFMLKANLKWQQINAKMLSLQKQILNASANYSLYAYTDRSIYELAITDLKIKFLIYLGGLRCEFEVGCVNSDVPEGRRGVLPDFDEVNCQYKTELAVPYMEKYFSIKVECNRMTTTFDAKIIKGSLQENLANGKYHGTIEIEGKIGSDKLGLGPVEVGTSVKAGAGIEFNESGIQDVFVTSEAQIKAGAVTVSSVEAKVSVISGNTSITGKGAFSGLSIGIR